ncbi:hypothetical protein EV639_101463 [Rathayibacter tanaceti]|uniref:Uncharacterized protein n=2 Tax=Rathayibacter tanaceti TaxID=1671680 RepID=A0ACD2XNL9_9MICO|nr:hypothetical protein ACH61_01362 [Rathayibacter tanaceti]TCO39514.1 hypothetical protein EV639_101463 [Rathayibacter tanaceti]
MVPAEPEGNDGPADSADRPSSSTFDVSRVFPAWIRRIKASEPRGSCAAEADRSVLPLDEGAALSND